MARPRGPQSPPSPEKRTFDPEEAAQAKERLTRRIAELKALDSVKELDDSVIPNYHSSAKIALDTAQATVRDLFGQNSDEANAFQVAQNYIQYDPRFPVQYRQQCVQEAIARLQSLIGIVDEKTVKPDTRSSAPASSAPSRRVFLVHGHNEEVKQTVARVLEKLDLQPIILHEQPDKSRTIIEKFEDYADVGFAVILMTGDDRGGQSTASPDTYRLRARQNVLLEMGFFLGSLGRGRVCVLYDPEVEMPSDYSGVLFKKLEPGDGWKLELAREINAAGIDVNLKGLL